MILEAEAGIRVVPEAGDGEATVAAARRDRPDVVLMDVRMPRLDGIEATRRILASPGEDPRVLMLTTFNLDEYVLDALRAGAARFLLKDVPPEQLVLGIRTVVASDALLAPAVTRQLIASFLAAGGGPSRPRPGRADPARARGVAPPRPRTLQRGDRRAPRRLADHGQDPRRPHPRQALSAGPRAGGRPRLRGGRGFAWAKSMAAVEVDRMAAGRPCDHRCRSIGTTPSRLAPINERPVGSHRCSTLPFRSRKSSLSASLKQRPHLSNLANLDRPRPGRALGVTSAGCPHICHLSA